MSPCPRSILRVEAAGLLPPPDFAMLKRTLAPLLLAATLCAASAPARAVTIPWATGSGPRAGQIDLPLSLRSLSDALALAGTSGFAGLKAARPEAGQAALAALVHAALDKMPWLRAEGRANGLWTWRRNITAGVAIYGPGAGGYSSFSWTRPRRELASGAATPVAQHWIPVAVRPNAPLRAPTGAPAPVPLPATAPMLVLALALAAMVRRRRAARSR